MHDIMLRTFTMKRCFLFVLLLGLFVAAAPAQSIIFVVRHAEKMDNAGNDPDLADAGISAVYTTEFKRTQQTAAPLAKALGLNVAILPAKDTAALIAKLHDLRAGNTLVVGHSNTIPDLIKAFGITTSISIAENDYDNLFMVVLEEKPRLIHLHY